MINQNNNSHGQSLFELGMEILARLTPNSDPEIRFKPNEGRSLPQNNEERIKSPLASSFPHSQPNSLKDVLRDLNPLPNRSIVIGVSQDELPIMLDLTNPQPGSILVWGDSGCGKTRLLLSIIQSGCQINPPRKFQFYLITARSGEMKAVTRYPHFAKCYASFQTQSTEVLSKLANIAEQRYYGREQGPAILLAIDDLATAVKDWDAEILELLRWLIEYGPKSQIWPVVTLKPESAQEVPPDLLKMFTTQLIGRCSSKSFRLDGAGSPETENLRAGSQFCVFSDGSWIQFQIPD